MNKFIALLTLCAFLFTSCCTITKQSLQTIAISSNPPGADIKIDGHYYGKTPNTVDLQLKRSHEIVLDKEGYHSMRYGINTETSPRKLGTNLLSPIGFTLLGAGVGFAIEGPPRGDFGGLVIIAGSIIGFAIGTIVGLIGTGTDIYTGSANQFSIDKIQAELEPLIRG